MTVSAALKWAWAEELPKEEAIGSWRGVPDLTARSAWSAIAQYGELMSVVDRSPNRWGCIPFDEAGWPHADAIAIANAVADLAGCSVDVPEGWHPMPDLAAVDEMLAADAVGDALRRMTVADSDGNIQFRARPDLLVVRHAILGIVPDWHLPRAPQVEFERWENGRHRWFVQREVRTVVGENHDGTDKIAVERVEVDGWSRRLQRPVAGAYRKTYLDPDPFPVMVARAEYEIFCAAMCMLHDQLDGKLDTIDLVTIDWPVQPWGDSPEMEASRRSPKILPDLSQRKRPASADKNRVKTKGRRRRENTEKST